MAPCKYGSCQAHREQAISKDIDKHTGDIIRLGEGFSLSLPQNFFKTYKKNGTVFKLNTLHQNGQKIALKWVRSSHDCNFSKHITNLTTSADMTASNLASFKACVNMKGWNILVVKPVIPSGRKSITIEPYITNLEKFNTNTFWECGTSRTYKKLIIAFSHFSYVASKGNYVLTNLCGGVNESSCVVTLLPPTVVSAQEGKFGCKDLGTIENFLKLHTCNSFCKDMPRPTERKKSRAIEFVVE